MKHTIKVRDEAPWKRGWLVTVVWTKVEYIVREFLQTNPIGCRGWIGGNVYPGERDVQFCQNEGQRSIPYIVNWGTEVLQQLLKAVDSIQKVQVRVHFTLW